MLFAFCSEIGIYFGASQLLDVKCSTSTWWGLSSRLAQCTSDTARGSWFGRLAEPLPAASHLEKIEEPHVTLLFFGGRDEKKAAQKAGRSLAEFADMNSTLSARKVNLSALQPTRSSCTLRLLLSLSLCQVICHATISSLMWSFELLPVRMGRLFAAFWNGGFLWKGSPFQSQSFWVEGSKWRRVNLCLVPGNAAHLDLQMRAKVHGSMWRSTTPCAVQSFAFQARRSGMLFWTKLVPLHSSLLSSWHLLWHETPQREAGWRSQGGSRCIVHCMENTTWPWLWWPWLRCIHQRYRLTTAVWLSHCTFDGYLPAWWSRCCWRPASQQDRCWCTKWDRLQQWWGGGCEADSHGTLSSRHKPPVAVPRSWALPASRATGGMWHHATLGGRSKDFCSINPTPGGGRGWCQAPGPSFDAVPQWCSSSSGGSCRDAMPPATKDLTWAGHGQAKKSPNSWSWGSWGASVCRGVQLAHEFKPWAKFKLRALMGPWNPLEQQHLFVELYSIRGICGKILLSVFGPQLDLPDHGASHGNVHGCLEVPGRIPQLNGSIAIWLARKVDVPMARFLQSDKRLPSQWSLTISKDSKATGFWWFLHVSACYPEKLPWQFWGSIWSHLFHPFPGFKLSWRHGWFCWELWWYSQALVQTVGAMVFSLLSGFCKGFFI